MNLLLDTHIALWALADDKRLSERARLLVENEGNRVFCSVISAWEVSIKHALHPERMLVGGGEFMGLCDTAGFDELPVAGRHVRALETLQRTKGAPAHKDPFDRMLIAQAKADGLLLLTHDSLIDGYDEPCVLLV